MFDRSHSNSPFIRFLVGGYSPHLFLLPAELLNTGKVIGVNLWGKERPCDYWIALDTFRLMQKQDPWLDWVSKIDAIRCMRAPKSNEELAMNIPHDAVDLWFTQAPQGVIPTGLEDDALKLQWTSSTAMAAINLAIVLGGEEVVLYGVDFVGDGRADGSTYPKDQFWERHKTAINTMLGEFQKHIKIYKTHPGSWLDCPLLGGL